MYFPVLDTEITDMSLSWPCKGYFKNSYPKELLGSWDDMSDNYGGAQGIDEVLVVWVEE